MPAIVKTLEISINNGSITAKNLNINAHFKTENGEINIDHFCGNICSFSANGNQQIIADSCQGINKIKTINGNIKFQFKSNTISQINCLTSNGLISTDWEKITPFLHKKKFLFNHQANFVNIETSNGNIYLIKK